MEKESKVEGKSKGSSWLDEKPCWSCDKVRKRECSSFQCEVWKAWREKDPSKKS